MRLTRKEGQCWPLELTLVQWHTQLLSQRTSIELRIGCHIELITQERDHVRKLVVGCNDDGAKQRLWT